MRDHSSNAMKKLWVKEFHVSYWYQAELHTHTHTYIYIKREREKKKPLANYCFNPSQIVSLTAKGYTYQIFDL